MEVDRHRDNKAVNISISMEGLVDKITNQNFVPVVDDNNVFIGIVLQHPPLCFRQTLFLLL